MIRRNSKGQFVKGSTDHRAAHWKGDKITYSPLHKWMHKKFGSPHQCEKCGFKHTSNRKIHWAKKVDGYSRKRKDWVRLCVPCHKKYDLARKHNKK